MSPLSLEPSRELEDVESWQMQGQRGGQATELAAAQKRKVSKTKTQVCTNKRAAWSWWLKGGSKSCQQPVILCRQRSLHCSPSPHHSGVCWSLSLLLTLPSVFTVRSVSLRAPTSRSENVDNNCIFGIGNGSHWSRSHRRRKQARRNTGEKRGLENDFIMMKKRQSQLTNKWKGRWEECLCKIPEIPKWFHGYLFVSLPSLNRKGRRTLWK